MIVAVIPARGGSKRIPRKNVKPFCGKPILGWTIEAARASGIFDSVIVSTDDEEIATVAREYGAEAPFRRPVELSDDFAPTLPVVGHTIGWLEEHRGPVRLACCIYATAPFLQPQYLREGLRLLDNNAEAEFAFSVTSYAFPIFRALKRNADGTVGMFWPENELVRSQDLLPAWHDAGQFYWGRAAAFQRHRGIFSARSLPVVLPRRFVQDVDTEEDWAAAEALFAQMQGRAADDTSS